MFQKIALCFAMTLVFASLVHAQKTPSPQPVNVVNTPTVTVSNSSLPVNGSVTVTNTSIPVTGDVQVSNLPLDDKGNVRTAVAPAPPIKYEFKVLIFRLCDGLTGICYGSPQVNGDDLLTQMSASGWELVSVVAYPLPTTYNTNLTEGG